MTIQQAAARKFGCSFPEAVRRLAQQGYSRKEACERLGYKRPDYRMFKRHGLDDLFLPTKATRGLERSAWHSKTRRGMFEFDGAFDTLSGHAIRRGLRPKTVLERRRLHKDQGPAYWLRAVE